MELFQPLVFEPYACPAVWGGRGLERRLGKTLPPDGVFGESWEISAHPRHISRIAEGGERGLLLTDLWAARSESLGGPDAPVCFPWLVKYLDCRDFLSVQVHPDDAAAARFSPGELGKTEAWVVIAAEPSARIYAGLLPGVTQADLVRRFDTDAVVECLYEIVPKPGDCFYLPAGTVHSAGGGVLFAEIQQSSDATFRLFDWNRLGIDGKPRVLHREEALASIDWTLGPIRPAIPVYLDDRYGATVGERLVACDQFILDRFRLIDPLPITDTRRMTVWMLLSGAASLDGPAIGYHREFRCGGTVLVPASVEGLTWSPIDDQGSTLLLRCQLP